MSSPHVLEIAHPGDTRKEAAADGTLRVLSGTDKTFVNIPMAEARDFRFGAQVVYDLGIRSPPSERAAIRIALHKPSSRTKERDTVSELAHEESDFLLALLFRLHDEHIYPR